MGSHLYVARATEAVDDTTTFCAILLDPSSVRDVEVVEIQLSVSVSSPTAINEADILDYRIGRASNLGAGSSAATTYKFDPDAPTPFSIARRAFSTLPTIDTNHLLHSGFIDLAAGPWRREFHDDALVMASGTYNLAVFISGGTGANQFQVETQIKWLETQ